LSIGVQLDRQVRDQVVDLPSSDPFGTRRRHDLERPTLRPQRPAHRCRRKVLADADLDIFHGLIVHTQPLPGRHLYANADQIPELHERGVLLAVEQADLPRAHRELGSQAPRRIFLRLVGPAACSSGRSRVHSAGRRV
jgi:hypothetical protein